MFGTKDNLAKDMKYWSAKVEDYVDRRNPYGKGASYADSMCEKAARRYHDFMEHDMNPIQRKLVADLQRIAGESGLDSKDMDHITYYKTKVDGHTYLILTNADRSGNIIIRDDGTIED